MTLAIRYDLRLVAKITKVLSDFDRSTFRRWKHLKDDYCLNFHQEDILRIVVAVSVAFRTSTATLETLER